MDTVTLICEEQEFLVPKKLLCDASDFFSVMFHSDFRESHTGKVNMVTIDADVMKSVISFITTGHHPKFGSNSSKWLKVLEASHFLQVFSLFTHCLRGFRACVGLSYFCEPWNVTTLYEISGLEAKIVTLVASNWNECITTSDFLRLNLIQLRDVLQCPELFSSTVTDVSKGVKKWIEFDYVRRGKCLQELLKFIDIRALPRSELRELIKRDSCLREFPESALLRHGLRSHPRTYQELHKGTTLFCFGVTKTNRMQTMYCVSTNTWSYPVQLLPPLTYGQYGRTVPIVFYGGFVFFIGFKEEASITEPATVIHKYCPVTNQVLRTCDLCFAVTDAGAAVLHGWVYILTNPRAGHGTHCNSVQRYSATKNVCEVVASTVGRHTSPYVFSVGDNLYVIGLAEEKASLERYDSISNQWSVVNCVPSSQPLSMCAAALCNDTLYVLEGDDPVTFYIYNFQSNTWRRRRIEGNTRNMWEVWPVTDTFNKGSYLLGRDNHKIIRSCRALLLPLREDSSKEITEEDTDSKCDLWHWSHTVIMNI